LNEARGGANCVIIILTDGLHTREVGLLPAEVLRLKHLDVRLIAFGVTNQADVDFLRKIVTSPPERNYFHVGNFSSGPFVRSQLLDDRRTRGSVPIAMQRSQLPNPLTTGCSVLDLAIILDMSGGIDEAYGIAVELAVQTVSGLDVGPSTVRVSVITYSETSAVECYFNTFTSAIDVKNTILYSTHRGMRKNVQSALRLLYETVFTAVHGDRSAVHNVAVVISDGQSNVQADRTIPEADAARQRGIQIFAVAVGTEANMDEIDGIANTPTSQHVVSVRSESDSAAGARRLLSLICSQ
jgi:hypothetical protein